MRRGFQPVDGVSPWSHCFAVQKVMELYNGSRGSEYEWTEGHEKQRGTIGTKERKPAPSKEWKCYD